MASCEPSRRLAARLRGVAAVAGVALAAAALSLPSCTHAWDDFDPRLKGDAVGIGGTGGAGGSGTTGGSGPGPGGATASSSSGSGAGGSSAVCGNGAIEGGEECDDENDVSGDGCADCSITMPISTLTACSAVS